MLQKIPFVDAHAHIYRKEKAAGSEELLCRSDRNVQTVFNASDPDEWQFLSGFIKPDSLSFGIHPWNSDRWDPVEWKSLYRKCRWIGEIGMDTLWCDIAEEKQQAVFEAQLEIAAEMKKPIVLHTKNCEARIADILREFPCRMLVHWYSGNRQDLKRFLDLGCWFTLGPDTGLYRPQKEQLILTYVPEDRILTETDGIGAVRWAYEEAALPEPEYNSEYDMIPAVLQASLHAFGCHHGLTEEEAIRRIYRNFRAFDT